MGGVILIVAPDQDALGALKAEVAERYAREFRVLGVTEAQKALETCRELSEGGEQVALVLAAHDLGETTGYELLSEARGVVPRAGRVLISDSPAVEEPDSRKTPMTRAMLALNERGVDAFVLASADPPEVRLYPALDELLDDWRVKAALPYLLVEAVMDKEAAVARIATDATVGDAAGIVAETRIGHLMVVDENGDFVGVLSEGDILRNALPSFDEIVEAGGTLHDAYQAFVRNAKELSAKPITPLVTRDPIVVGPGDHVAQAATILTSRDIRRLPVVEDGRLVGTISRANICQAVAGRT